MTWADAMEYYGCDKPDIRFDMKFVDLTAIAKGKNFAVFDDAEYIGAHFAPLDVPIIRVSRSTS